MGAVWRVTRAEWARRWDAIKPEGRRAKAHGAKQATVAAAGGLGQNAISRLLTNKKQGTTVETFVRAIIGLGVKPSEFFAAIEDQFPIPIVDPPWSRAATLAGRVPQSAADDARAAQQARLMELGLLALRYHDAILAARDVPVKKHN